MSIDMDRREFGARQAEMTQRWYDNVKQKYGDVDAYIATRHAAYLDRWREAARFIPEGAEVLDVGGGNLYPALIDFFKDRRFRYSYLDVDPGCVAASENLARSSGLDGSSFQHGYNDSFSFDANRFEALFSSHCLEHSIDLESTFAEANRVLVDGGNLLMAVPFGWEENPEHPYFFGPDEWLAIVLDAGFEIRTAQIGREYPESGHDYFVSARKVASAGPQRIMSSDYAKASFDFISCFDERVRYSGTRIDRNDHVIVDGEDWRIEIDVPAGAVEALPVLTRHDWSGIVDLEWGGSSVREDLYSWFSYVQPVRVRRSESGGAAPLRIAGRGCNSLSRAKQGVLYGVMFR